jgi:hypothetical protein
MLIDFAGCFVVEKGCKLLFAELEPMEMVTRGRERREARRREEERVKANAIPGENVLTEKSLGEKKVQ